MIETLTTYIFSLNGQLVLGVCALTGALVNAGYSIYKKKKASKKFKFDSKKLIDTIWQSTLAGVAAASIIGPSLTGMAFAALAGVGVDTATNKASILNLIQLLLYKIHCLKNMLQTHPESMHSHS